MRLNGKLQFVLITLIVAIVGYFYFSKKQPIHAKTIFIFMGAPGSGKGTLADKCVTDLGFTSLSTGNLLREAVAKGEDLGKEAEKYMKEGKLVPDTLVTSIVSDWLTKNLSKIDTLILDGYPRTARQAELFLDLLHKNFENVSLRVVDLIISDETIIQRLSDRLVCEKCQRPYSRKLLKDPTNFVCDACGGRLIQREDDKAEVVRKRLKVYAEHVRPLIDIYTSSGIQIDQLNVENKLPQEVFDDFKKLLEETVTKQSFIRQMKMKSLITK